MLKVWKALRVLSPSSQCVSNLGKLFVLLADEQGYPISSTFFLGESLNRELEDEMKNESPIVSLLVRSQC